jgi:DNA repair protein RadC
MTSQPVARDHRVREKMLLCGAEALSDTELLTIFISSGNANKSCVQLAHDLTTQVGDVRAIVNSDPKTFQQVSGLGIVRYLQLQAIRELCRRSDFISLKKNTSLTNTQEAYTFIKRQLRDKKNETFVALFLDSQHRVLTYEPLFTGTINKTSIYPRPIITRALALNAAAMIIAHNHPSGVSDPSPEDITATTRLQKALALVDVVLLDHLVIGDNEVYSIKSRIKFPCQ